MVRIAQTPRNHQPAPTADAIRSGPWRPYGVSTPQRSCEPCGRRACAVTLLRPGTRHPPRVDSCFNFNNVRIGPFTTQPHALHLLANLVHVQSEPQLLRSDGNCHTQSLLGARVATSRSTRNAAVGPRTSRIFRVVTQPTFGMGLSALSASVSARQALGIGHTGPQSKAEQVEPKRSRLVVCAPEPSHAREFPDVAVFSGGRANASQAERLARAVGRVLADRGVTGVLGCG